VHHTIHKVAVVGHQHHRAFPVVQVAFQPFYGLQIKVVRGLVQEQQVGRFKQQPGEHRPRLLPAAEIINRDMVIWARKAEADQHLLGTILVGVPTQRLELVA